MDILADTDPQEKHIKKGVLLAAKPADTDPCWAIF